MRALITIALIIIHPLAAAAGEDLATCQWPDGSAIKPQACEYLREAAARDQARADQQRLIQMEGQQRAQAQQRADEAARAAAAVERAEAGARQAAAAASAAAAAAERDRANLARFEREDQERKAAAAKALREIEQAEAHDQAVTAARRKTCGADFGQPRVGMTLDRARQCVGAFRLVGEMAMPGGNVATYRAGWILLSVRQGVVVSFQRP